MKKISIIILNYINYDDTIDCVESILGQTCEGFSYEIIIVDNCSLNNSFNILTNKYRTRKNIHVLKNKKNEGYAQGNNRGIFYSLNTLKIKEILILNNDTIMIDKLFLKTLSDYNYKTGNIGAIGTRIIGSDNIDQNPVFTEITYKIIWRDFIVSLAKYLRIYTFLRHIKHLIWFRKSDKNKKDNSSINHFYILHGSAILLTPLFFEYYEGFYSKTFLYYEENILAIMLKKVNLNWVYIKSISLHHKEDKSSNLAFSNLSRIKEKFLIKSTIHAFLVKLLSLKTIQKYSGWDENNNIH